MKMATNCGDTEIRCWTSYTSPSGVRHFLIPPTIPFGNLFAAHSVYLPTFTEPFLHFAMLNLREMNRRMLFTLAFRRRTFCCQEPVNSSCSLMKANASSKVGTRLRRRARTINASCCRLSESGSFLILSSDFGEQPAPGEVTDEELLASASEGV